MRPFILAITLCLLATLPAFALGPKLYAGGSLSYINPTGDFSKKDFTGLGGAAKSTVGGEVDLGVTDKSGSFYLGYRWATHKATGQVQVPGTNEFAAVNATWWLDRWLLGARWHILGELPIPITPTLGGGLTWGKSDLDAMGKGAAQDLKTSKLAEGSIGWFLEAGGLLYLTKALSLTADLQYHNFNAKYNSPVPGVLPNGTVKISFFTAGAGVRINLM